MHARSSAHPPARRMLGSALAIGLVASGVAIGTAAPAVAATGDPITGTIWQDYDSDGTLDSFEDTGRLGGVEVRAFDGAGNVAGPVLTAADGTYSLPVTSDAPRWRVEANVPDTAQWNGWEDAVVGRADGTSHGTTVQFVDVPAGGAAEVDFSFQVPGAYVENNPMVFLPAYRYGASDGAQGGLFGGTAHLYDAMSAGTQSTVPTAWNVPFNQLGATFGTAWQQASAPGELGSLFASAYVRRHSGLGPDGIGAIYRITPDDGTIASPTASADLLVDLAAEGIDLGADSDPGAAAGDPNGLRPAVTAENPAYDWRRDAQAWDKVGRVGLGGMEITTDQRYLFAVNLYNRSLVRVEIDRTGTSVVGVDEFELDEYFPDGSDLRPFGISSNPLTNELYLTVTDTAESTGIAADLHAHVFAFSPEDPTDLEEVLDFGLGYNRGAGFAGVNASYQPWSTDPADYAAYYNGDTMASSVPVVSDARYLHGEIVIGIRALDGDLFGSYTYLSDVPTDMRVVRARTNGGELLMASGNGDGTFTIEQNGVVDGRAGAGAATMLAGPTGPNKFFIDQWLGGPEHLGAVLVVPSRPDGVMETGIHVAEGSYQVGTRRFFQENGSVVEPRGAAVITGTNVLGVTTKGNGLGELTALASAAPIEIGNYVWYDVDNDGVQDPEEAPVVGATVNLYEVGDDGTRTLVSSTLTSAAGEYYFSSDPALNANGYALQTNTDYVVGIDNPADYDVEGAPLFGWYPTVPDTGDAASVDADRNDSDGLVETTEAGAFPYAAITTGGPGQNDHTIDFGYSQLDYEFDKRMVEGPVENPADDGTWTVSYELVVENPSDSPGSYLLSDDLTGYGTGIEVVSAEVVDGPDGAPLNAAWDGTDEQAVLTSRFPIAAGSTEESGTAHVYTVEVSVRLATDATTGEVVAPADELTCTPDQAPGDATTGLFNVATLDPIGHADLVDDECGDLPLVTLDKTIVGEPEPVDPAVEPGLWRIVYGLAVTNSGAVATEYDLSDDFDFGTAVQVESVGVANTGPGGVVPDPAFDGETVTTIAEDAAIEAATTHTFEVTVEYRFDTAEVPADPAPVDCAAEAGADATTRLLNGASTSFNGYPDFDTECREQGHPSHLKEVVSAEPIGDGRWQVVYDITVVNIGTEPTTYDLDDELLFAPGITAEEVAVSGPDGFVIDPAFDGETNVRIATDVALPGLDDDGYAPHVYTVAVIAEVPIALDEIGEDGTGSPVCGVVDGPDLIERGLNNAATLTDEAGGQQVDTDCAGLPSLHIAKSVVGAPVVDADGDHTIVYEIVVTNDGASAGDYTVTDQLRFGAGIDVEDAEVTATPDGVTAADTWTGEGEDGAEENIIAADVLVAAGDEHVYTVEVVASVDHTATDAASYVCPADGVGAAGAFANVAGIGHNDAAAVDVACAAPQKPGLAATGVDPTSAALAGLLALLVGGALSALVIARRKSATL